MAFVKLDTFTTQTVFVLDATLVGAVAARLRLELNVAQLQHGCHQLQHRLHLVLHEAHDLHGILGRGEKKETLAKCKSKVFFKTKYEQTHFNMSSKNKVIQLLSF